MIKILMTERNNYLTNFDYNKKRLNDFVNFKKNKKNNSMKKKNELLKQWRKLLKEWLKKNSNFCLIQSSISFFPESSKCVMKRMKCVKLWEGIITITSLSSRQKYCQMDQKCQSWCAKHIQIEKKSFVMKWTFLSLKIN